MRILGIDPGYDRCGVSVVEGDPSRPQLVWSDCIIPPKGESSERLGYIANALETLLRNYAPDAIGIERLFFSTNKKTALKVAEARGVILSAAGVANIPILECSPQDVKLAVTGYGNADKKAVAEMVPRLISLPPKKRLDDEFDAIAVAITALAKGRAST